MTCLEGYHHSSDDISFSAARPFQRGSVANTGVGRSVELSE